MKKIAICILGMVLISLACRLPGLGSAPVKSPISSITSVAASLTPNPSPTSSNLFPTISLGPEVTPTPTPGLNPTASSTVANRAGQIVFVSCQSQNSLGMGTQCGISIMNADGSRMRPLTNLDDDIYPSLSPDGRRVAFRSLRRDRNDEIYVINSDGSNLTRLTNTPGENTAPTWSADGSQIAFRSNLLAPNDPAQIFMYVMGADGSNPHRFTQSSGFAPRWSLDGSQIVFLTFSNNLTSLNSMNADGTQARVIKTNPAKEIQSAVWSPDGTQIAFLSQKTPADPIEVDLISADGKNQHSLTPGYQVVFGGLSWSPDGQKLLFSMHGDGKSLTGALQLYTVDADGSNLNKLAVSCTYCYDPDWGH